MKIWSRVLFFLALPAIATACGGNGVRLAQDLDNGGVVVYPFTPGQGHMLSTFRKDAVRLMEEKCPSGHTIVREGETKGRSRLAGPIQAGGGEMIQERRWGIQFQCK
ncbi:hypothetical protein [Nitrospira sp. Nam80]